MSADLVVGPVDHSVTRVEFRGNYQPPFDAIGRFLDRVAFHRVAESTVRDFLDRLCRALEAEVRASTPVTRERKP
jgi:hypothetical protein